MCWASTSSGLAGTRMVSIWPASIRCTVTAQPIRSVRCLGNSTPWEISPTWWPARPMRCRPLATDGGASTWITRSTAPMSMPSSRLEVATTAFSRPLLRSSSTSARCSLLTEPWWARASSGSAPSLPLPMMWAGEPPATCGLGSRRQLDPGAFGVNLVEPGGESLGEPARVGEHDRGVVRLDQVDDALLDVGPDRVVLQVGHVGHRHLHRQVERLGRRRGHDGRRAPARTGSARPPRAGAPSPTARSAGRAVCQHAASSRSSDSARCAPRLVAGDGVHLVDDHRLHLGQRLAGRRRQHQEQRLGGGDQDVGRLGDQLAARAGRGVAGAHTDADGRRGQPGRSAIRVMPGQRGAQVAFDVDGQRLERRHVEHAGAASAGRLGVAAARPAGRSPTGTPPASCPTRSAR